MRLPAYYLNCLQSNVFVWSQLGSTSIGVVDASDLKGHGYNCLGVERFGAVGLCGPIYDDSCDVGFNVESTATGVTKTFALYQTKEQDGEVIAWIFRTIDRDAKFSSIEIHILND